MIFNEIHEKFSPSASAGFCGGIKKKPLHEISMRYPTLPQEGVFMEALKVRPGQFE